MIMVGYESREYDEEVYFEYISEMTDDRLKEEARDYV